MIKVNKLSSTRNLLPYEYYSLPYCKPGKIKSTSENLGEVLRGDRILTSPYKVNRRRMDHVTNHIRSSVVVFGEWRGNDECG